MGTDYRSSAKVTDIVSSTVIEAGRVAREQGNIKCLEVTQSATSHRRDSLLGSQYQTRLAHAE
jgi:hypothetical protein